MLRFDPSGAVHPEYGVTAERLQSLYPHLLELRRKLMEETTPASADSSNGFYRLPAEQLEAYKQFREASELGRIFKVANSQMDILDAVVVLGIGGSYLGPLALIHANCDPYHNELRRGPRGGKPRIYFEGNNLDNDTLQALLSRIAAGGYGDNDVEDRWGIVVISKSGKTTETKFAFHHLLSALKVNLEGESLGLLGRLVVPITGLNSELSELAKAIGCEEIFSVPENISGPFSILSAVGMLPAAMLGLDIMKLNEGAVAMNEHFEAAPPKTNVVLQYVAINYLLAKHRGRSIRVMSAWDKSLESVGWWYDHLLSHSLAEHGGAPTPMTIVQTRDLHVRHRQHLAGRSDKVFNNLIVQQCRTDPLPIGGIELGSDTFIDGAEKFLPDLLATKIGQTNAALHEAGHPTTDLILPTIDTFTLGQLFQMLMIATKLESDLLETDSCSPATEVSYSSLTSH